MNRNQRLELTWVGKDNRPKLEPRILLEDPSISYHAKHRVTDNDLFDNRLIYGDNLLALKALEADYSGKIKCVFIDPPYNTGSAFTHYDDGLEHSIWLSMMRDRIDIIRRLLADDGSLWITIDDNEAHYLKVICDEIFGRRNFIGNIVWQKAYSVRMDAKSVSMDHDHILAYRKTEAFSMQRLKFDQADKQFNLFDERTQRYYRRRSLRKEGSNSLRIDRPNLFYPIIAPDGIEVLPIKPNGIEGNWRWGQSTYLKNIEEQPDLVEWVKVKDRWELYVKQYKEDDSTRPASSFWPSNEVGHNHEAKEEVKAFNPADVFSTPKPERLLKRILEISTNAGDLVLDSFAGSGTTGAVAQKMRRRWIMIELGQHAKTHIVPRLKKVIDGNDKNGISNAVSWNGGGGFRYYQLAPSLLEQDQWGNWIINKSYNPEMLTEALCKLEGFKFAPSESVYWKHGFSTENDFLYVTTSVLTHEQLQQLSEEVGADQTLLVLCPAFRGSGDYYNLTVKKIPKHVLNRCEWGHDDYSLRIENLTQAPLESGYQHNLFNVK
ncbi:site-specific DNA-methyltransferase [Dyadobacter sediminis]|uniref:site-specific DNA-methyltransferase (adenine-specific) n=1 Tax=Dyadobacter sediminis TaxID=1493691 RepID=A0A5R9K6A2_9BACT|nr:site-specific DNA-methyltransferase [Dyadobacter sediminis]TLU89314.1 site-specific DNA-methyltransferase [Dyadobacter sediminis]GGC06551.1 site-specific DNA-methyltransferase [Dyadobacter sediminis]